MLRTLTILAVVTWSLSPSTAIAQPPVQIVEATSTPPVVVELTIPQKVELYATKHNVSAERMLNTMKCENKAFDPKLQSYHHYKNDNQRWGVKAGEREKSFGLVQIHLPDHPSISYENATDGDFAIEFMAKEFKAGRAKQWTCYRALYGL